MTALIAEITIAATLLICSVFFYFETYRFPKTRVSDIGPEYWPQLLLAGLILLSVWLLYDIYARREDLKAGTRDILPYPRRFWYTLVLAVAYTLIMPVLGFTISTLIFSFSIMRTLGMRQLKKLLIIAPGTTAFFVLLFPKIMAVPMPRGTGVFRAISLLFY
jgi:hypothetical protein